MKLGTKIVLGMLAAVCLVMAGSTIVLYVILSRQNRDLADDELTRSIRVIRQEFQERQEGLMDLNRQIILVNKIGETAKTLQDFGKKNPDSFRSIYTTLATVCLSAVQLHGFAHVLYYDGDGDLVAFALPRPEGAILCGFHVPNRKPAFESITVEPGKRTEFDKWDKTEAVAGAGVKLPPPVSEKALSLFENPEGALAISATVPVIGNAFDKEKGDLVEKQFGVLITAQTIGKPFVEKMSRLLEAPVNLFSDKGLIFGRFTTYDSLQAPLPPPRAGWTIADQDAVLNAVELPEGSYFQAVLPLYGQEKQAGAVAILKPRRDVRDRTLAVIRWLGLVFLVCLALILPMVLIFSSALARSVRTIVTGMIQEAENLNASSDHMADASQSMAQGASEQAASLEEITASLEELASMSRRSADHAGEANQIMKAASDIAGLSDTRMQSLTRSMDEMKQVSEETSKIVKTIDEIAFQTNLLALNAAVEAARAGEAGAGFAVVADEVRNLAIRAAEAARNTSDLISRSLEKNLDNVKLVAETSEAFSQMNQSASRAVTLIDEIASAVDEQARSVSQLNLAVSELDKVTQQNAASAEEIASTAGELNGQSDHLTRIVGGLSAFVDGNQGRKAMT